LGGDQRNAQHFALWLFSYLISMQGITDKQIIWIVLIGSFITLLLVAFLVSFVYFHQRRHFAFLREKQQIRSQFQEELLKTRLEIQEETFKSISEEIHDNIGQTLSFIKLNMNTMSVSMSEKDHDKWVESKELLTKVIQDLRHLSKSLNTDFIQQLGLVNAIRQQLSLLERTGLYQIGLTVEGERWPLPASKELLLYRVIQELLNNVVKHAEAVNVRVAMDYNPDCLNVTVSDDGKGFEPEEMTQGEQGGIGLRNIVNRIAMMEGSVTLKSSPGAGTVVVIYLPQTSNDSGKI